MININTPIPSKESLELSNLIRQFKKDNRDIIRDQDNIANDKSRYVYDYTKRNDNNKMSKKIIGVGIIATLIGAAIGYVSGSHSSINNDNITNSCNMTSDLVPFDINQTSNEDNITAAFNNSKEKELEKRVISLEDILEKRLTENEKLDDKIKNMTLEEGELYYLIDRALSKNSPKEKVEEITKAVIKIEKDYCGSKIIIYNNYKGNTEEAINTIKKIDCKLLRGMRISFINRDKLIDPYQNLNTGENVTTDKTGAVHVTGKSDIIFYTSFKPNILIRKAYHEIGHELEKYLEYEQQRKINKLYNNTKPGCFLTDYSSKNEREFFAENYEEYKTNPIYNNTNKYKVIINDKNSKDICFNQTVNPILIQLFQSTEKKKINDKSL